ncbi:MAG: amino acid--tRNA ligase-related protein [Geodermatophilaceae bacterium]
MRLDLALYLRIAPELYLKRCIIGDLERVYELNRNFRNEGVDATHSPEFAMLEFYQSYADYADVAALTTRLIQACARALHDGLIIQRDNGETLDLSGQWPWQDFYQSVSDAVGEAVDPDTSARPAGRARRCATRSRSTVPGESAELPRNCSTSWSPTP